VTQEQCNHRGYLAAILVCCALACSLAVLGCVSSGRSVAATTSATSQLESPQVIAGVMTNAAPVVTAAAGAAAAIPGGQGVAVGLGALAALLSALGGFLARHYSGAGQTVKPSEKEN